MTSRPDELPEDGLRRSVMLFRSFLEEQSDPQGFYNLVGADAVRLVARRADLAGKVLVDVGAGPGYYREAFEAAGTRYVRVDADSSLLAVNGGAATAGLAESLPLVTGSVDIAFSSNVLEHVRDPWVMADEMVRVTRPGGLVVLSYTNWLSPWGGHETSPWHYLGGDRAARRYERRHGHPPKNVHGRSLFEVSVAAALTWARAQRDLEVLDARPRYLPTWAGGLVRLPGLREVVTWNLWMVARRR